MAMPKGWEPNKKDSDNNDDYLYNSRNSVDNYSIDNDVNRNFESQSFNNQKSSYKNKKPISFDAKFSLGLGLGMFIFWLFVGILLKAFTDWFFWLMFFLFVIILPVSAYGKSTSKSRRRTRRRNLLESTNYL